jgi:DNA-binding transcriptional LysR family regulator
MHVTLRQLRVLLAVADTGSFSGAALAIGLSQSAVSQSLKAVEEAVGLHLVERTTRRVALTEAGEELVEPLRRALDNLEDVLKQAQRVGARKQKIVRIAATPLLSGGLLAKCLSDVTRQLPDIQVQLKEQGQQAALDDVRRGDADFALAVHEDRDAGLRQVSLLKDHFVLVCRNDHPFSRKRKVGLEQLRLERLVMLDAASGGRPGLDRLLQAHGVARAPVQDVAIAATAFDMVRERLGIAIVPASCVPVPSPKSLRVVALDPAPLRDVVLVSRKTPTLSPDAEAVHALILAGVAGTSVQPVARPLNVLVPFPRNGPVDSYGRTFASLLAAHLGKDVVVTNTAGLGGTQGVHAITRSQADGYTIGLAGNGATVFNSATANQALYDVFKDLTFLSGLVRTASVLVVGAHTGARSFQQLLAQARLRPGCLVIGTAGTGTSRVMAELLQRLTGVLLIQRPYDGLAPAMQDLARSKLDMVFGEPAGVVNDVRSGRAHALLVTGAERCPLLPDVPSAAESDLADLAADGGYCLVAPPSLPAPVLERLSGAIAEVLQSAELAVAFEALGVKPDFRSGPYYADFVRSEQLRWRAFRQA